MESALKATMPPSEWDEVEAAKNRGFGCRAWKNEVRMGTKAEHRS